MRVTTRPGASGVPRWSSLEYCHYLPSLIPALIVVPCLDASLVMLEVERLHMVNLLAKIAGRSLLCSQGHVDLCGLALTDFRIRCLSIP